jgi:predicted alpha/beta-hydrolase family hydrolase
MRDEHLQDVHAPMLFVQGARDAFGSADEIRAVIKNRRLHAELYAIEGGDHSFKVPKSLGVPQESIYEAIMDEVARWIRSF